MSSIHDFLATLKGGGARQNRFEVVVNFPAFAGGADEIRKTPFLVQSTNMPGANLGTLEVPFRGRQLKLAGDRTYDEWEATFYADTSYDLYDAFERWHNAMNQFNSNTGFQAPDEYMSTVGVYQLDNQDNRIKEKNLLLAWPSMLGPIELSQDGNDTISLFTVTFQYSDIQSNSTT